MVTAEVFTNDQTTQRYHELKNLKKKGMRPIQCVLRGFKYSLTFTHVAIVIYIEFLSGFMFGIEVMLLCSDMQTYS